MAKNRNEYIKKWMRENRARRKSHLLKWYYKNRDQINMMMSKPKAGEPEEKFLYI